MEVFELYSEKTVINKANTVERKFPLGNEPENFPSAQQEDYDIFLRNSRDEEVANRALLLLSFKNTSNQNLKNILNILGIETVEEKKKILKEIFHLIQAGIIYIPKGLPNLIDKGVRLDVNNPEEENIDLILLKPFNELIMEIQKEITNLYVIKE